MKLRNILILAALLVLAIPFHAAEQAEDDSTTAVCVADQELGQDLTLQIEQAAAVAPVCHGQCTYSTGSSTYTEPCNNNCKCPRTHNGNRLYQFSCDNGTEPAAFGDDEAVGSLP